MSLVLPFPESHRLEIQPFQMRFSLSDMHFSFHHSSCLDSSFLFSTVEYSMGFPDSSVGKESTCNAGEPGSIPGQEDLLEKG